MVLTMTTNIDEYREELEKEVIEFVKDLTTRQLRFVYRNMVAIKTDNTELIDLNEQRIKRMIKNDKK